MKKIILLVSIVLLVVFCVTKLRADSNTAMSATGDKQIGAVEIKDASNDYRADVNDANTARATTTHVIATQPIDAEGHVVDWSDLDDSKTALQVIDDWDESDRAKVNIISGQVGISAGSTAVGSNTPSVTLATNDPAVTALQVIDNVVGTHDSTAVTSVTQVGFKAVDPASLPSDVTAGDSVQGIADLKGRQIVYLGTKLDATNDSIASVSTASSSATGMSMYFDSDCDNTAQAMNASAGNLYKLHVYNSNAAVAFVQLFNVASGSVTPGVTTPNFVVFVPSQGAVALDLPTPMSFTTATTYTCTTTATGSGDPTTGLTFSAGYK